MKRLLASLGACTVLALLLVLAGCGGDSSEMTQIEGDVPAGMPVMYEFYTDW